MNDTGTTFNTSNTNVPIASSPFTTVVPATTVTFPTTSSTSAIPTSITISNHSHDTNVSSVSSLFTTSYSSISSTSVISTSTLLSALLTTAPSTTMATLHTTPSSNSTIKTQGEGESKLVCHSFTGRLGNQLFQFASTLGISYTLNRVAVFKGASDLESWLKTSFKHPTRQAEFESRCDKAKSVGESSCCKYDERLTQLDPNFDYWVGMYLQSWKYFDQHKQRILQALTFSDSIVSTARDVVQQLREKYKNSTLIAVHNRRGDFASEHNRRLGYPTAPPEYFNRSMTYFKSRFSNPVFVVASEDINWCKANFPSGFEVTYLDQRPPAVDMRILSSLDHIVTTFGTFTWWAGYLNPGVTVYMKDFIVPNSFIGNQFEGNGTGYIYPEWIPI